MAIATILSDDVREFIRALGFDPHNLKELHIHFLPDEIACVETVQFILEDDLRKGTDLIKRKFELKLKEEELIEDETK